MCQPCRSGFTNYLKRLESQIISLSASLDDDDDEGYEKLEELNREYEETYLDYIEHYGKPHQIILAEAARGLTR